MNIIRIREQILEDSILKKENSEYILPFIKDGEQFDYSFAKVKEKEYCLKIKREGDEIRVTNSYFVGLDWIAERQLAVQVFPKMNNDYEIDYVKMLEDALCASENYEHLNNLIAIDFKKASIKIKQRQDILGIFLITEYLNMVYRIVKRGLRKSFYLQENNLKNKVKGHTLVGKTVAKNLSKGKIADNYCSFQVYDIDTPENRILKRALRFCVHLIALYSQSGNFVQLANMIRYITPYFDKVSDCFVNERYINEAKSNPIYREYANTVEIAKLIMRRYGYNITLAGKEEINTPPYWIDMSKLFELYVYQHLKKVFSEKGEVRYHAKVHYQEPDFLLKAWGEPYIVDAKYKPRYKSIGVYKDDAREVGGYARLSGVYAHFGLDEETTLPIKCLVIYPDQDKKEYFTFNRSEEPLFDKVKGYVRFYKQGIRLPVITLLQENEDCFPNYRR